MMSMYKWLLVFVAFGITQSSYAQENYWVYFKDKGAAIASSNLDAPVYFKYLEELEANNVKVIGASKWLNAACISMVGEELPKATCIERIVPLKRYKVTQEGSIIDTSKYGNSDVQLKMLNLDKLHAKGYTGEGVKLALFDAGFFKVDSLECFKKLWAENRIAATYDFVTDGPLDYSIGDHGMYVLSIAGGRCEDSLVGAAPEATFYLARTENGESETHLEEYYWVYALEWAYDNGVDIIHSSLGYSVFDSLQGDYTYEDMDGETTIITQATKTAIAKGIFVTNSAGNQGDKEWRYITAPCDGKGVLCVGAVDSFERRARFSSVGPSSDGRVKPEVMAMGRKTAFMYRTGVVSHGNGTSFSGPLIAGMVACLMEANPEAYNTQIFDAIIRSADRYDTPDSLYGYGIPDALVADSLIKEMVLSNGKWTQQELKLYPNPSTGIIYLEQMDVEELELFSIIGEKLAVYNVVDGRCDLSGLAPGVYFLKGEDKLGKSYKGKILLH